MTVALPANVCCAAIPFFHPPRLAFAHFCALSVTSRLSMPKRKRAASASTGAADADEEQAAAAPSSESASPAAAGAAAAVNNAAAAATSAAPAARPAKPHPCIARYASVNHWLLKNEPPYSLAALKALPSQTEPWVGVRSHEACNIMRYGFRPGQRVLYYNASIPNPHVAGVAVVAADAEAKPDPTAWDASSPYFDPHTDPKTPTWFLREVRYEKEFVRPVYLAELRLHSGEGGALHDCSLFRKLRLSIHPLSDAHFRFIEGLQHTPLPEEIKLKPERSKSEGGAAAPPAPHPSRNRKNKKTKEAFPGAVAAAAAAAAVAAPATAPAEGDEQGVGGADGSAALVKEPSSRCPSLNRATTAPAALLADADSSRAAKRQRRQKA